MNNFYKRFSLYLQKNKMISKNEQESYEYACKVFIHGIINIILTIIIGLIFGMIKETLCFLISFFLLRKFTGGLHAKNYHTCLIYSTILLILSLLTIRLLIRTHTDLFFVLLILSEVSIWLFSPIVNENKVLSLKEKKIFQIISIGLSLVVLLFIIIVINKEPVVAYSIGTGLIADVVDVVKDNQYNDNHYVYLRSTNNDSFLSKIKVKEFPEIITFRSLGKNSLNYESQKINCIVKYTLPDDKRIEVGSINCITNKSQHSLVIGIGRGVNKETINKLCMLSKEYNIKVVCTKPLVENKTFLFENQVGQSGFTICPDVYLALGISGSIQHLLGIKNCKKIIAVNTDELANIHSVANFSIIQDCNIFVDKLIEYIEKRKQLKGV